VENSILWLAVEGAALALAPISSTWIEFVTLHSVCFLSLCLSVSPESCSPSISSREKTAGQILFKFGK